MIDYGDRSALLSAYWGNQLQGDPLARRIAYALSEQENAAPSRPPEKPVIAPAETRQPGK